MIVRGILDALAGITRIVADRIGEAREHWAEYATTHPSEAALLLESAARDLEATVKAMKPWRRKLMTARRRMAKAEALRLKADDIRDWAKGRPCDRPLRRPL